MEFLNSRKQGSAAPDPGSPSSSHPGDVNTWLPCWGISPGWWSGVLPSDCLSFPNRKITHPLLPTPSNQLDSLTCWRAVCSPPGVSGGLGREPRLPDRREHEFNHLATPRLFPPKNCCWLPTSQGQDGNQAIEV